MNEGTRAVKVRIAGEEHVIRAAAEPEHTRRCARLVDERITEARIRAASPVETPRATILAALSIADELFQTRAELERLGAEIAGRAEALSRRIEAALSGAPPAAPGEEGPPDRFPGATRDPG